MIRTTQFFEQARNISLPALASRLGLHLAKDRCSAAPCPACGHTVRSHTKKDHRPPVGFRTDGRGWECQHCHEKGDGIDLAAYCIGGSRYRELSDSDKAQLRDWYISQGLVDDLPRTTASFPPQPPIIPLVSSHTPKLLPMPSRPPQTEVMAVWESCLPVTDDPHVVAWFREWQADPKIIARNNLARVLPSNGPCFSWMIARSHPWQIGWRLIVPALSSDGEIQSLKARWLAPKEPPGGLKSASPRGYQIGQLVTTNANAQTILRTGQLPKDCLNPSEQRFDLWLVEGEKDLLVFAGQPKKHPHAPLAVFGIWAGSWTQDFADRLPLDPHTRIIIATDPDDAGETYAHRIYKTLLLRGFKRTQLARWLP